VYDLAIARDTVASIGDDDVAAGTTRPNHVKATVSHEYQVIARAGEHDIGAGRVVEWGGGSKLARTKSASSSLAVPSIGPIVAAPADQQIT
jgi:hypothetical protein